MAFEFRADQLHRVCMYAPVARVALMLPPFNASLPAADISTPLRGAMYLAQLAHESAEFRCLQVLVSGAAYDPLLNPKLAAEVGNTKPGDGRRYKGRGAIPLTGRANYAKAGPALELDLLEHPELAAEPANAFRVSAWFWRTYGLNAYADAGDVEGATRRINGGLNGLVHRLEYYRRSREALGLT